MILRAVSYLGRIYDYPPLSWGVSFRDRIDDAITAPGRRREVRELREIADLTDGLLEPKTVRQLRELADLREGK